MTDKPVNANVLIGGAIFGLVYVIIVAIFLANCDKIIKPVEVKEYAPYGGSPGHMTPLEVDELWKKSYLEKHKGLK